MYHVVFTHFEFIFKIRLILLLLLMSLLNALHVKSTTSTAKSSYTSSKLFTLYDYVVNLLLLLGVDINRNAVHYFALKVY